MLIAISIMILAYMIMGKDITPLLDRVRNIDWRGKINTVMEKLRPWALKAGRVATRPLLQFYYVMKVCQKAHLLFFTHKTPTFTSWGFVIP